MALCCTPRMSTGSYAFWTKAVAVLESAHRTLCPGIYDGNDQGDTGEREHHDDPKVDRQKPSESDREGINPIGGEHEGTHNAPEQVSRKDLLNQRDQQHIAQAIGHAKHG